MNCSLDYIPAFLWYCSEYNKTSSAKPFYPVLSFPHKQPHPKGLHVGLIDCCLFLRELVVCCHPNNHGQIDQLGRSPPWHGGGREFKSRSVHFSLYHLNKFRRKMVSRIVHEISYSIRRYRQTSDYVYFLQSLFVIFVYQISNNEKWQA